MKNIQVGGSEIIEDLASELTAGGTEGRLQRYAVGEIFIINPSVVPNARRDGFEDSPAWRAMKKDIRTRVAKRIVTLVRAASKSRSTLKTILAEITNLERQVRAEPQEQETVDRLISVTDRLLLKLNADKLSGIDPNQVGEQVARVKGLRDALVEAKGRIMKQEKGQSADPKGDPERTSEPEASGSEDDGNENIVPGDEGAEDEDWSGDALLAALIEVLVAELGEDEASRLVQKARDNLSAD